MTSPLERSLTTVHRFAFAPAFRIAALPFGIHPGACQVEILGPHLTASFGPWRVTTPLSNIDHAEVTGPYQWFKVIGPPHLSRADSGLTFATNGDAGVCLQFRDPVRGIDPFGVIKHPGLTVTVTDPQRLVDDITEALGDVDSLERDERTVLEGRTAAELRALARTLGIEKAASMKKAELVDRILSNEELAADALEHEIAGQPGSS